MPESELEREVKTDQDVSTFKADRGIYAACSVIDDVVEQLAEEYSEDGTYNGFHQAACDNADLVAVAATPSVPKVRSSGKLPGWGTLIEVCTSKSSNLGVASNEFSNVEVVRITEDDDFSKPSCVEAIKTKIREKPGTSLHGSLPCTVWSLSLIHI